MINFPLGVSLFPDQLFYNFNYLSTFTYDGFDLPFDGVCAISKQVITIGRNSFFRTNMTRLYFESSGTVGVPLDYAYSAFYTSLIVEVINWPFRAPTIFYEMFNDSPIRSLQCEGSNFEEDVVHFALGLQKFTPLHFLFQK